MHANLTDRLLAVDWVTDAVALDEVDSTNLEAARRIEAGAGPGLVVVAGRQTAGRGRRGRTWQDVVGGNLALSAVVTLGVEATWLPLAAGLALRDVLAERDIATSLKWPNDVRAVVDGQARKCAGILVETRTAATGKALAVVGIGVNVDWRGVDREPEADAWTSLAEVLDAPVDASDLAVDLVAALGRWHDDLGADAGAVRAAAVAACDTLGRRVRIVGERDTLVGRAIDLDHDGALVVDADGRRVAVRAGDVVHLRDARP